MKVIDSTEAKTNFGALLDAAQRGPVEIKKKGRPVAVMVSCEDFEVFEELKLKELQRELQIGIDALARGESRDAKAVFDELLGRH
ncbi:MAG: type II toxin-antitoxin system Phd/YefM family antitoxin [Alphaproteobacteria bacterium]|nr:type II toxin-antitoxin system Phd/YefM family antitoxin [Alphaproteobacteria bacterium]